MVLLVTTDINIGCPKFQLLWTEYDMYMVFGDLRCLLVFSTGFGCSQLVLGQIGLRRRLDFLSLFKRLS